MALYAGEKLSAEATEAFEGHYFGCDRCWNEVQRATEIRASARQVTAQSGDGTVVRGPWSNWRALAAAAALAFGVLGAWQWLRPSAPPVEPLIRGGSDSPLAVQVERDAAGGVTLNWKADPEARIYVVEILQSDGFSLFKQEAAGTKLRLDPSLLSRGAGKQLFARIEAQDAMGQVVAKSALQPVQDSVRPGTAP